MIVAAALLAVPLTAVNFRNELSPGWNLGNTLEAIPKETSWGNPVPTEAFFRALRKAGFRSVRLPAAWSKYADKDHRIDAKWLDHVADVVRMARRADLVVMLNVHWDGGWMQPLNAEAPEVNAKFKAFWTQIATKLRDFDDRVLFAGTNEIHVENVYSAPTPENAAVQNGFNQLFVDVVRSTGGKNRDRWLVVQTYNTDIDHGMKVNTRLPKDPTRGRLAMEVHFYSPYNFTINDRSSIWQWGATATDPKATETWANEAYVDAQFEKVKTAFIVRGVPVILGEYAADAKPKFKRSEEYRRRWIEYVTKSAFRHGCVPMYWDNGAQSRLFDRATGAIHEPDVVGAILAACR